MTVTSAENPTTRRRQVVNWTRPFGALAALVVAGTAMAATGIGTGSGPISHGVGTTFGINRSAPSTFSSGIILRNHGWFDVQIESIRPIPRGDAASGMPLREVSFTLETYPVGMSDGSAEPEMPRSVRRPAAGFVLPPSDGSPDSSAFGVATWELVTDGEWAYDGYEVIYRHGFIRHRAEVGPRTVACPDPLTTCD
ncbi:hypothetical protein ACOCJ4_06905 [Knoellia sp. CPCC 206435]|uniref:hypothetical protein n=1 Tax=Knoellia terrae TaxID=3404797 RepID=UPI003B42ABDC